MTWHSIVVGVLAMGLACSTALADRVRFNEGWRFDRYGSMADGSKRQEPQGLEKVDLDDSTWRSVKVPHDWAIEGPFRWELEGNTGKLPWKGVGWYRKTFDVPASDAGKRIFVDFDGVMAYAKVYCNGEFVGTWPYGYNSFRFDLTPFLKVGQKNLLAVRADTDSWDSRWYPGAGIYRNVWIVKANPVHIAHHGTFATTPTVTDEKGELNLKITVDNQSEKTADAVADTAVYEYDPITKQSGKAVATLDSAKLSIEAGKSGSIEGKVVIASPKRWDITTPTNQYVARTQIKIGGQVVDEYDTPFGFRTVEFTARDGFKLNGRRVEINGTCNHHDLGALGAAMNDRALERQLEMLKEMGCNALRTSHNPPTPELLELADRMGFLVMVEAFDAWKQGKKRNDYNKLYDEWHEKDLRAMVRRDRNHPSVFMWSIGNEIMEQRKPEFSTHLTQIVKSEDATRPVTVGCNAPKAAIDTGFALGVDIMGCNYFMANYAYFLAEPRYAERPLLGTETSSCISTRGEYFFPLKRGADSRVSFQVSSYDVDGPGWAYPPDEQFEMLDKYRAVIGEFVWTGWDYLGEPTPYNGDMSNLLNFRDDPKKKAEMEEELKKLGKVRVPSRSSYFGIIDLAGFKKDRFYSYQARWRSDVPMAHIFPHWNWPERVGQVTPVHVYTSGDEAELFLNGRSLGRKQMKPLQYRFRWDDVVYEPGELKVVTYKKGTLWATDIVKTTGAADRLILKPDRATIAGNGDDLSFVTVGVADAEGAVVPRTHPAIQFAIDGPGEIVAVDNGDPTSFESFQADHRQAFNGLALVIVRGKGAGTFKVRATSDGLSAGECTIMSK